MAIFPCNEGYAIAIARAVVRRPAVLILDEALNAVEEWRERKILENIKSHLKDSLIVVISHRSSVLKMADEIYVLEGGALVRAASADTLTPPNR